MRKIHKERLKGIAGIILILLAIGILFSWESFGREALTYDSVIVFKDDIQKGTIIQKDMLGIMKLQKDTLIDGTIQNPDLIIGKRSNTFIPRALQLCNEFFSDPELVTGDGNNILSVPMDWIYSFPQTLRRGDLVHFYLLDKKLIGEDEENKEVFSEERIKLSNEKPLISAKIAYVKDSSNREVIDVTPDRLDGSAEVAQIEVVISEDKYKLLKTAASNGQIFVIMYE